MSLKSADFYCRLLTIQMSDLQSNYPRNSGIGLSLTDIDSMKRAAKIGQIALLVLAVQLTVFLVFPGIIGVVDDSAYLNEIVALGFMLAIVVAGIAAIWSTMFWVTRTHRAVCALRGITPQVPSKLIGFASGIPYILLNVPLCYTIEFLVIRSGSPDTPTMRWNTMLSKSKIVNVFGLVVIIDSAITFWSAVMEYVLKKPTILDSPAFEWFNNIVFWIAVILGIRIAKIVNQNIASLASPANG